MYVHRNMFLWGPPHISIVFLLLISFSQIITLGAVWKTLSGIIEFNNLKPNSIYVAMSLLFILLSGRAYYYTSIIQNAPSLFILISFSEIMVLWAVWKMSEIESNKAKTSIVKTGIARGMDWQWTLIGFSFLLLLLISLLLGPLGGPGADL